MADPRRTSLRPFAARTVAPREPVDPARIGRRVVRRQAKGMEAAARGLEDAWFDARQVSRHVDPPADEPRRAEPAEWERIDQPLAAAAPGPCTPRAPTTSSRPDAPPTPRPAVKERGAL
ncbi:hypothetical protein [Streptomyces achromogenes]|uniref:hypothetical protein n=1 Tax=Streptomyces achromogenes TaxID=67255 RepID=UPI003A804183